jgi:hypothetical protein
VDATDKMRIKGAAAAAMRPVTSSFLGLIPAFLGFANLHSHGCLQAVAVGGVADAWLVNRSVRRSDRVPTHLAFERAGQRSQTKATCGLS